MKAGEIQISLVLNFLMVENSDLQQIPGSVLTRQRIFGWYPDGFYALKKNKAKRKIDVVSVFWKTIS